MGRLGDRVSVSEKGLQKINTSKDDFIEIIKTKSSKAQKLKNSIKDNKNGGYKGSQGFKGL